MLERCPQHPHTKEVEESGVYESCGDCRALSFKKLESFPERCPEHPYDKNNLDNNKFCPSCKDLVIAKLKYKVAFWNDAWHIQRGIIGKLGYKLYLLGST